MWSLGSGMCGALMVVGVELWWWNVWSLGGGICGALVVECVEPWWWNDSDKEN